MSKSVRTAPLALTMAWALFAIGVAAAAAQDARGAVRGRVVDAQGGALPGVTITATSPDVGGAFTAVSDAEGAYRLLNLPAGSDYAIVAQLDGFNRFERRGLEIRAGLNLALD